MDQLQTMFPNVEKDVILAVYTQNNESMEMTVAELLDISAANTNRPLKAAPTKESRSRTSSEVSEEPKVPLTKEEQIAADEKLAMKLQARESKRHQDREIMRVLHERLVCSEDDGRNTRSFTKESQSSVPDLQFITDGIKKGVEGVKNFIRKLSTSVQNATATTPRTEYGSLPTNDFGKFLDDDDQDALPRQFIDRPTLSRPSSSPRQMGLLQLVSYFRS